MYLSLRLNIQKAYFGFMEIIQSLSLDMCDLDFLKLSIESIHFLMRTIQLCSENAEECILLMRKIPPPVPPKPRAMRSNTLTELPKNSASDLSFLKAPSIELTGHEDHPHPAHLSRMAEMIELMNDNFSDTSSVLETSFIGERSGRISPLDVPDKDMIQRVFDEQAVETGSQHLSINTIHLDLDTSQDSPVSPTSFIPPNVPPSPLVQLYKTLLQREDSEKTHSRNKSGASSITSAMDDPLTKVMHRIHISATVTTLSSFRPIFLAFQLCLIEQDLFQKIKPKDFLSHRPPSHPEASILASTHFFNYMTRIIEDSILQQLTAHDRASVIQKWIKVAKKLYELRNFQTLKAVTSAFGTPPIMRLKQTWSHVSKKRLNDLKALLDFLSEQDNFSNYRKWMKLNIARPMIPYVGIYLHDLTYILALETKKGIKDASFNKMVQDIFNQIRFFQGEPLYSYKYFSSILQGGVMQNIYAKPKKLPITPGSTEELLTFNTQDEETVGSFIAHWILTQRWYPEKVMDELSLTREPRDVSPLDSEGRTFSDPGHQEGSPTKTSMVSRTYIGGKTILDTIKSSTRKAIHRTRSGSKSHKRGYSNEMERIESQDAPKGSADLKTESKQGSFRFSESSLLDTNKSNSSLNLASKHSHSKNGSIGK